MINKDILKQLNQLSVPPETGTANYEQWIQQQNFFRFLLNTQTDEVPLYVSHNHTYLYSLFLPISVLKGGYVNDLLEWDARPDSSWGYGYSFGRGGKPKRIRLFEPFDSARSSLLKRGIPITFLRSFEGRKGYRSYVEINQFLTHLHGLHKDEAVNSFCRLDEDGNIEQTLKIHHTKESILVTLKSDVIDFHQFLTKTVLVRLFDRMVCRDWKRFAGWGNPNTSINRDAKNEIFWRAGIQSEKSGNLFASYVRGFQIIRSRRPRRELIVQLEGKPLKSKKYEKFIAWDWKNKRIAEVSCDPKKLGNYFVKSNKPFETSPVFFKQDVLLKYKADPDKYSVSDRKITCRGTWGLETYDINEKGQIHTYLVYLGRLPHSEQLYWKSFNERPKCGLSKRALKTDFKGEWDLSYDPLLSLKKSLQKLQKDKADLWRCNDEDLYRRLNYPVTDAEKEWVDEIHALDKLVIEGFFYPCLKSLATSLGCFNERLGSIRLLESIFEKKSISKEEIKGIVEPLIEIHNLRTKFAGHRSGKDTAKIKDDIVKKHGDLKAYFRALLQRTDQAIQTLLIIQV